MINYDLFNIEFHISGPGEAWNSLLPPWLHHALHSYIASQIGGQGEIQH